MSDNLARETYSDPRRWELIDGKPVMMARPSVNHYQISENIHDIFKAYLKGKFCIPFGDGVDLRLDEGNRFIPDMMVVCDRNKIKPDGVHGAPDLVVEVLSPGTANNDKGKKKKAYEKAGVREYWIVSPLEKSVEVWLLENGVYELDHVYSVYPDYTLETMDEEERAAVITEFRCSLFDDLAIRLDDVFKPLF